MLAAVAILVGASLIAWAVARRGGDDPARLADAARSRQLAILDVFAPAVAAAAHDPRAIAVWQPIARAARALFPDDFAALDRAYGRRFPFSAETIQDAHAHWTTDWLSWERNHDLEFKRRAALAASEPGPVTTSVKAALDAIENEKLELYQRRYSEYVRVARALQQLVQD